jgi:hypothetical protein
VKKAFCVIDTDQSFLCACLSAEELACSCCTESLSIQPTQHDTSQITLF